MTPASERDSKTKEDDVESVELTEEFDDEYDEDDESCDEEKRVRFKVRGLLRVNNFPFCLLGHEKVFAKLVA